MKTKTYQNLWKVELLGYNFGWGNNVGEKVIVVEGKDEDDVWNKIVQNYYELSEDTDFYGLSDRLKFGDKIFESKNLNEDWAERAIDMETCHISMKKLKILL
jgi:hypothetical protein